MRERGRGMRAGLALVAACGALGVASAASARPSYVSLIPNDFECLTCHVNPIGGGRRNDFGDDFGGHGAVWAEVFAIDSDGDGFTNGDELGDPEGVWRPGDPDPGGIAANPGDPRSVPVREGCGDGALEQGEQCDREALGGATCQSVGFEAGVLACGERCLFDTSGCRLCGNGVREEGEACDGFDTGGQSCRFLGFHQGRVVCTRECALDASGCHHCGDGVRDEGEACDGEDLGESSCGAAVPGSQGALSCDEGCALDTSGCVIPEQAPEPEADPEAGEPEQGGSEPEAQGEEPGAGGEGGGCAAASRGGRRPWGEAWAILALAAALAVRARRIGQSTSMTRTSRSHTLPPVPRTPPPYPPSKSTLRLPWWALRGAGARRAAGR